MHFTQDQILQELQRRARSTRKSVAAARHIAWRIAVRTSRCLGGAALALGAFALLDFGWSLLDAPVGQQSVLNVVGGLLCWAVCAALFVTGWFWAFGRAPNVEEERVREHDRAADALARRQLARRLHGRLRQFLDDSHQANPRRQRPSGRGPALAPAGTKPRRYAGTYASIEYALAATSFVHSRATDCSVGLVLLRPRSRLASTAGSPSSPRRSALKVGFKEARLLRNFLRQHPGALGRRESRSGVGRSGFAFFL